MELSIDHIAATGKLTQIVHIEDVPVGVFTSSQWEFLLSRHKTLNLNPVPSGDPQGPLNWLIWKKNAYLLLIAFHGMTCTFMASRLVPAFEEFAEKYGKTLPRIRYLVQILFLGIIPFFWKPIAAHYGRYPIFLVSTFISMVCNIGGVFCHSYATQMATRIIAATFICLPICIGSPVVAEVFFSHQRAQKMGYWTHLMTVGALLGPFVMGFVVTHASVQWLFWIFAVMNLCQFTGYIFFNSETLYIAANAVHSSDKIPLRHGVFLFRRIVKNPFAAVSFYSPLLLARYPNVIIPTCTYSIIFCFVNIATIVEMPVLFGLKFHLSAQQLGLQSIGLMIGHFLGEQLGRPLSDFLVRRRRKHIQKPDNSYRIKLLYIGLAPVITGIVTFIPMSKRFSLPLIEDIKASLNVLRKGQAPVPIPGLGVLVPTVATSTAACSPLSAAPVPSPTGLHGAGEGVHGLGRVAKMVRVINQAASTTDPDPDLQETFCCSCNASEPSLVIFDNRYGLLKLLLLFVVIKLASIVDPITNNKTSRFRPYRH